MAEQKPSEAKTDNAIQSQQNCIECSQYKHCDWTRLGKGVSQNVMLYCSIFPNNILNTGLPTVISAGDKLKPNRKRFEFQYTRAYRLFLLHSFH